MIGDEMKRLKTETVPNVFCREKRGWSAKRSLLMDGGNENSAINLRKVF